VPYIWRPGDVFRRYLKAADAEYDEASFELGAMYFALEVISHIKLMEERAVVSEYGRNEAIAALHTLLQQIHIADEAYAWYDKLIRWRQPTFVASTLSGPKIPLLLTPTRLKRGLLLLNSKSLCHGHLV